MELNSKYGKVKIYAKTVEDEAIGQIIKMSNSPIGENAHIRIMPDCHAGAGCVIGTTMKITDKVCPNLVGVDIGCGVDMIHTNIDFKSRLDELDKVIRKYIPYGLNVHSKKIEWRFDELHCWDKLDKKDQDRALRSLCTLGGGNHFIECYEDGWIAVHTGSRNIGFKVAKYYQDLAKLKMQESLAKFREEKIKEIEPQQREEWIKANKMTIDPELAYLTGEDMEDYLHDIAIMQEFAKVNRVNILLTILQNMNGKGKYEDYISSIHNYIDVKNRILRKGAISAQEDQKLVIPLNMRDGVLVCVGKGNPEWNYSAPHGAGRLYSRSAAQRVFTVDEYAKSMEGIYSTCINQSTLDEAPFVYKDFQEIIECIEPTVEILERLIPIYNFKAN